MCGRPYRPRPANGSGDSPRPPFLSEFVNHIGKLSLVEVVYHLFGGTLRVRIHPHIKRPFRLKTESARGIVQLQAADAEVGEYAVRRQSSVVNQTREGTIQQGDLWPVLANSRRPRTDDQFFPCDFQRSRALIEPNQMSRCAEAFCDFVTVPAKAHRGVDI